MHYDTLFYRPYMYLEILKNTNRKVSQIDGIFDTIYVLPKILMNWT